MEIFKAWHSCYERFLRTKPQVNPEERFKIPLLEIFILRLQRVYLHKLSAKDCSRNRGHNDMDKYNAKQFQHCLFL